MGEDFLLLVFKSRGQPLIQTSWSPTDIVLPVSSVKVPETMSTIQKLAILCLGATAIAAPSSNDSSRDGLKVKPIKQIALGPRPYWLVDQMDEGPVKEKLASCSEKKMKPSAWSIGHRGGGTLQFPEHSTDSIVAGVSIAPGLASVMLK